MDVFLRDLDRKDGTDLSFRGTILSGATLEVARHLHALAIGARKRKRRAKGKEKVGDIEEETQGMEVEQGDLPTGLMAMTPDNMLRTLLDVFEMRNLFDMVPTHVTAPPDPQARLEWRILYQERRRLAIEEQAYQLATVFNFMRTASWATRNIVMSGAFRNELYRRWYMQYPSSGHPQPMRESEAAAQLPIPEPTFFPSGTAAAKRRRQRAVRRGDLVPTWYNTLLYDAIAADYLHTTFRSAADLFVKPEAVWQQALAFFENPFAASTMISPFGTALKADSTKKEVMRTLLTEGVLLPGAMRITLTQHWVIRSGANPVFPGIELLQAVTMRGREKWFEVERYSYFALVRRAFQRMDAMRLPLFMMRGFRGRAVPLRRQDPVPGFSLTGSGPGQILILDPLTITNRRRRSRTRRIDVLWPSIFPNRMTLHASITRIRFAHKARAELWLSAVFGTARILPEAFPHSALSLTDTYHLEGQDSSYDPDAPPGRALERKGELAPSTLVLYLEPTFGPGTRVVGLDVDVKVSRGKARLGNWIAIRGIVLRSGIERIEFEGERGEEATLRELMGEWGRGLGWAPEPRVRAEGEEEEEEEEEQDEGPAPRGL